MSLGTRNLQVGSRQLVKIDYSQWLDDCREEQLTGAQVSIIPVSTPATAATVDTVTVLPNRESLTFVLGGPFVTGDQFNIMIVINTTLSQSRIDLIGITAVAIS